MAKKTNEVSWLDDLESKVKLAAKEITRLKKRVVALEAQLDEAAADGSQDAWKTEREEVRKRVEGLVEHLSSLLQEDD